MYILILILALCKDSFFKDLFVFKDMLGCVQQYSKESSLDFESANEAIVFRS